MSNRFRLNVDDFLGYSYQEYRDTMYGIALSTPSDYTKIRREVMTAVKKDAVKDIYTTFYNILSLGTDKTNGTSIIKPASGPPLKPGYPEQKIADLSLKASRTLDALLNEVIQIILPANFEDLANKRSKDTSVEL